MSYPDIEDTRQRLKVLKAAMPRHIGNNEAFSRVDLLIAEVERSRDQKKDVERSLELFNKDVKRFKLSPEEVGVLAKAVTKGDYREGASCPVNSPPQLPKIGDPYSIRVESGKDYADKVEQEKATELEAARGMPLVNPPDGQHWKWTGEVWKLVEDQEPEPETVKSMMAAVVKPKSRKWHFVNYAGLVVVLVVMLGWTYENGFDWLKDTRTVGALVAWLGVGAALKKFFGGDTNKED